MGLLPQKSEILPQKLANSVEWPDVQVPQPWVEVPDQTVHLRGSDSAQHLMQDVLPEGKHTCTFSTRGRCAHPLPVWRAQSGGKMVDNECSLLMQRGPPLLSQIYSRSYSQFEGEDSILLGLLSAWTACLPCGSGSQGRKQHELKRDPLI